MLALKLKAAVKNSIAPSLSLSQRIVCRAAFDWIQASEEKALDFNPAVDAMNAFRIATLIVFGANVLTIGGLSKRWELDGWEDWRIFIEAGHLGKALIPTDWSQSASKAIPDRLRPTPTPLSEQELTEKHELIRSWHWKKKVDREWEVERNQREAERLEWETRRKALGKRIW
ncbi:hypothetical protein PTTG_28893 [Puccinia triticina 1-1 BBBD Race 1]|uniref:Uncharacterized protein n=1 Tax=Puccinia triticina (isolate 1-1 / race 1 (BBBD)) TaxID=630390 RepID=A0A180G890_PUCT1|nr:hypothetical protein PTTG_28893 [Puccinia triticina 1-1 BBBD Race 1]